MSFKWTRAVDQEQKKTAAYLGSHWDPRGAIWAAPQYLRSNKFISFHHPSNMSSSQRYTAKNMQITVRSHGYMIIMGLCAARSSALCR